MAAVSASDPEGVAPEWLEVERFFARKDKHYAHAYLQEQAHLERFHEQTRQGIHACRVERAATLHLNQQLLSQLQQVENSTVEDVQKERQARHIAETSLERLTLENLEEVQGRLAEENKINKEAAAYTAEVSNEVCHLYNEIEQARNFRVDKSAQLQEAVQDKLDDIQVALDAERKIREESTSTLLELFGSMGQKLQQQLDAVKSDRRDSSERLINLMEEVLPRLEKARHRHIKAVEERLVDNQAATELANDAATTYQRRMTAKRRTMAGAAGIAMLRASSANKSLKSVVGMVKADRASKAAKFAKDAAAGAARAISDVAQTAATPRTPRQFHARFDDI